MTEYLFQALHNGRLVPQNIEVFTYPMGDVTVRRIPDSDLVGGAESVQVLVVKGAAVDWTIVSAWTEFVESEFMGAHSVLVVPYLPSARGDKDTPAPAKINARLAAAACVGSLVTLDPHSDVWLDTYRACSANENSVSVIDSSAVTASATAIVRYDGVIAPDKGAVARASAVARRLDLPLLTAVKHRDPATGHLSRYQLNGNMNPDGVYLVVDDICDGGGTFVLLAQAAPDTVKLDLWVTHGGFTKGLDHGLERYRSIYVTDSLGKPTQSKLQVVNLDQSILAEVIKIHEEHFGKSKVGVQP